MLTALAVFILAPAGLALAAAPEVTIQTPLTGSSTNDQTPTFSGTTDDVLDLVTLAVYRGASAGGSPVQSSTALPTPLEGAWTSTPVSALEPGQYTARAEQTNAEALTGVSSEVTFTVDITPPAVSIDPVPSPSNDSTPTLTGLAGTAPGDEPSVSVTIYTGSSVGGSIAASESVTPSGGAWSYAAPHLSDGTYTAQASQRDEAGNIGMSAAVTFTVDTTPPDVSIDAVASVTNDPTPTLAGGAGTATGDEAVVSVTIYRGSSTGGSIAASEAVPVSGGAWSYTAPHLSDGIYTAQASQLDEAGNLGRSSAVTFTVDTTPPAVSIDAVASPTNDPTPSLAGAAGTALGDEAVVSVTIYRGSFVGGSIAASEDVAASGDSWSFLAPHLGDGTYTAQASQRDEAGNIGTSAAVTFTVDTTPPAVSINTLSSPTNDPTPTLTGNAGTAVGDESAVTVTIYDGSSVGPSVAASGALTASGGKWSYTATHLSDGTYTAQASQRDHAGNVGKSSAMTFTVDTTPPAVSINAVASATSNPRPTLTGNAGVAPGDESTVTITIFHGGTVLESKSAPVLGAAWSYTTAHLSDGTYTAQASQRDEAGNVGETAVVTFTVNTLAPVVSLRAVVSPTNDSTPTLGGSASGLPGDEATVTIRIYSGAVASGSPVASKEVSVSGGEWSYTSPHLDDGTYTARASQQGDAGTGESVAMTFTVDTTPPAVLLTSPANGAVLNVATPTFSGLAGQALGDEPAVTLKVFAGTSTSGTPLQTLQITPSGSEWTSGSTGPTLPNGIYTALAEQSDDAGNLGTSSVSFAISLPVNPGPGSASAASVPSPSPPVASFQWFPATPHTGEPVSLASTSTDTGSSITGFAWSLTGGASFTEAGAVLSTSFSTAGPHVVQLRVTDANGLSSVAAETITVTPSAPVLMQPFPVVRIAGTENYAGVKVSLLTVEAPVGATVTVACRGHGCPVRSENLVATAGRTRSKSGVVLITFRRFERALPPGATLEIRVSMPGEIGKYTRFTVRRGKLPARVDSCLSSTGMTPIECPSS